MLIAVFMSVFHKIVTELKEKKVLYWQSIYMVIYVCVCAFLSVVFTFFNSNAPKKPLQKNLVFIVQ